MTNVAGYTGKYKVKSENKEYWFYCLTLGKDMSGKRIQVKKRGFISEKDAKKALRDAQVTADKGEFIQPNKSTFGEYLLEWFENRRGTLGRLHAKNSERNIQKHILPLIGNIQLLELNVIHIERMIGQLRQKGLAEETIKKNFSLVSSSLISATKKGLITKNVAALADNKPKVKRKLVEVWDTHEVRKFLDFTLAFGTRYYIAFHLALTTGMRQGEILGLRWQDIDFRRKIISVKQSLSHDGLSFGTPKTEHSIRSITIDDATVEALQRHRESIQAEKSKGTPLYLDYDLVAPTNTGRPCNPRSLDKLYCRIKELSEMRHITFHDLRHTHASLLLKNNVHPKVVSERLGHSSIQITLDLYSHLFPNMQEDAAAGLGKMLFQYEQKASQEADIELHEMPYACYHGATTEPEIAFNVTVHSFTH
ncbi:tyrosine-type recombinase/integrase [Cohnella soli]|uniref:Tyrosine-type recombinase/integrase n=1 Tax=Cohnella soli TaxID=425005 RepID=A0ABW0HXL8_9BACL